MTLYLIHLATVLVGVAMIAVLVVKVTVYPDNFNWIERAGMAISAGTIVLRSPAIMNSPEITPFSDWSTLVFMIGLLMMHAGRLFRLHKHAKKGDRARDAAELHLRARGKL
ncbi:MAG: hypothetical protein ABW043_16775 [Devosia sp.]|uniref:hypothetical protein n=1 Tax=Devosia sp. TaxID=1871048 RepID=UPI00339A836F